jgi:hypothetical protein
MQKSLFIRPLRSRNNKFNRMRITHNTPVAYESQLNDRFLFLKKYNPSRKILRTMDGLPLKQLFSDWKCGYSSAFCKLKNASYRGKTCIRRHFAG